MLMAVTCSLTWMAVLVRQSLLDWLEMAHMTVTAHVAPDCCPIAVLLSRAALDIHRLRHYARTCHNVPSHNDPLTMRYCAFMLCVRA